MNRNQDTTCIECKRFGIIAKDYGYSEYTPGNEFAMFCRDNVWEFEVDGMESEFSTCLRTAAICDKFQRRNRDDL